MIQRLCGRLTGHWWDRGYRCWAEQHQQTAWNGLRSFYRYRCRLCGVRSPQGSGFLPYAEWEDLPA